MQPLRPKPTEIKLAAKEEMMANEFMQGNFNKTIDAFTTSPKAVQIGNEAPYTRRVKHQSTESALFKPRRAVYDSCDFKKSRNRI